MMVPGGDGETKRWTQRIIVRKDDGEEKPMLIEAIGEKW